MSDSERFECGNGSFKPKSAKVLDVEGVQYAQVIVECPSVRQVPRGTVYDRAFYLWQPHKGEDWQLIPVSDHARLGAYDFDMSVDACADDEEQAHLIEEMILMADGEVTLLDA